MLGTYELLDITNENKTEQWLASAAGALAHHAKKGDTRQYDMLHKPDSFRLVIEIIWALEKIFLYA
jgi:hypothetical protein